MNAAAIAQLAIILAPIAKEVIVEGSKIVATMRDNLNPEELNTALELSKATSWPNLDFKAGA